MTRLTLLAALALMCACATAKRPSPPPLEVESAFVNDARRSKILPAWLAYGMSRRFYIDLKFADRAPKGSVYHYTFEEELEARDGLAGLWAEMRTKEAVSDPYLDEVSLIHAAGFMKEYVWHCVPHPAWTAPTGLRSAEFRLWLREQLPKHRVETWVKAFPSDAGMRVIVGVPAHAPAACATPASGGGEVPASGVDGVAG